jgi:hypothetical protein
MKLPRWLMISMLTTSVLAVLAAAGWWWVAWPERTAREFVERLVSDRDGGSWKEMMLPAKEDPHNLATTVVVLYAPDDWSNVQSQPRSPIDFCIGQHRFRTIGDSAWEFVARRNKVIGPSGESSKQLFINYIREEEKKSRARAMELLEKRRAEFP